MAANPRFEGPLPPKDSRLGWCALCAALYKGSSITSEPLATEIQRILRGDVEELLDLDVVEGLPLLQEAVTWSFLELPGPGGQQIAAFAPSCWSHDRALKLSSIAPVSGFLPTGMEPLLGQGGPRR